jgi:hypothetical protein
MMNALTEVSKILLFWHVEHEEEDPLQPTITAAHLTVVDDLRKSHLHRLLVEL